jgi:hypothetical protein
MSARTSSEVVIGHCPVCRSTATREFLRREGVPVHQNLLYPTPEAARRAARGTLRMCVCRDCGFIFNAAFVAAKLEYGPLYDASQDSSSVFAIHRAELVRHLVESRGIRGRRVVELGCGKGTFLRQLVSFPGGGNSGFGFDPSYTGPDTDLDGRLRFHRAFFDESCDVEADAVVCRHVIEHVADPVALLGGLRRALGDREGDVRVFFETPDVDWILRNRVIWDFFYEHCSLFTESSLRTAFETAGFRVSTVRRVFEAQYLWLEAEPGKPTRAPRDVGDLESLALDYAAVEEQLLDGWRDKLGGTRVAIWGAGAKGSTFANLVDPDGVLIDCVVDLNPNKQGHFLPGTGHPIVDYRELPRRGVGEVILMNPNYREENRALLDRDRISAVLVE